MNKCKISFLNWKEQIAYWNEYKEFNQDGACEICERKTRWVIGDEDGTVGCWYCLFSRRITGPTNHHESCKDHIECEEELIQSKEKGGDY